MRVAKNDKITTGGKERPFKVYVQTKKVYSTVEKTPTTGRHSIWEEENMIKSYVALIFSLK